MDLYKEKYLKYKSKYFNLKEIMKGGIPLKMRVLIVVDLQNCFLEHFGTLGWQPLESQKNDRNKIITIYKERIQTLLDSKLYDIIVFTKDSHPFGHSSFNEENGLYPPHCTDNKKICKNSNFSKNNSIGTLKESINRGKDLITIDNFDIEENMRYKVKIYSENHELTSDDKIPNTKQNILCDIGEIKGKNINELNKSELDTIIQNPLIVRLNKGELCKNDAYSAFLYHTYYKNGEKDILEETSHTYSNHTTGLYEFLKAFYTDLDNLTIDVCGLVTNICVVNTCVGGLKIFRENNNNKVKINLLNEYSLNLHIPIPDAIEKMKKCNLKENTDYEIINDISESTEYNKIYFVNEPAADKYIYDVIYNEFISTTFDDKTLEYISDPSIKKNLDTIFKHVYREYRIGNNLFKLKSEEFGDKLCENFNCGLDTDSGSRNVIRQYLYDIRDMGFKRFKKWKTKSY